MWAYARLTGACMLHHAWHKLTPYREGGARAGAPSVGGGSGVSSVEGLAFESHTQMQE